jgi:hypothetical protein
MPNGSIIHNETNIASPGIPFTIDTNISNINMRTDFVICEHEYIEVVGGQPPTYFIQKGPDDGTLPVLANPEKQVIVGVIEIAPNGYQFADLTYLPTAIPLPAGMIPQDIVNYITSIISIGYATTTTDGVVKLATPAETAARVNTQSVLTPASVIHLVPTGTLPGMVRQLTDSEVVANTPVPGTPLGYVSPDQMRKYGRLRDRISRAGGSFALTVADNGQELTLEGDGGTTPIVNITIPTGLPVNFKTEIICVTQNINFLADSGITIVVPTGFQSKSLSLGARLIIECVNASATLFAITGDLKVLQPAVSTGLVPMRAAVPYFPASNVLTEFDGTGLGIATEVLGWAICNGQNGTRDLRGQFLVGHDTADALFNNVGDQGGSKDAVVVEHSHTTTLSQRAGENAVSTSIAAYSNSDQMNNVQNVSGTSNTAGESGVNKNLPPFYTTLYIQRIA